MDVGAWIFKVIREQDMDSRKTIDSGSVDMGWLRMYQMQLARDGYYRLSHTLSLRVFPVAVFVVGFFAALISPFLKLEIIFLTALFGFIAFLSIRFAGQYLRPLLIVNPQQANITINLRGVNYIVRLDDIHWVGVCREGKTFWSTIVSHCKANTPGVLELRIYGSPFQSRAERFTREIEVAIRLSRKSR
ncbi:MAG: hypothetical protein ACK54I_06065 [Planctomycetota bacterium]